MSVITTFLVVYLVSYLIAATLYSVLTKSIKWEWFVMPALYPLGAIAAIAVSPVILIIMGPVLLGHWLARRREIDA